MTSKKVFNYESEENLASLETHDKDLLLKKITDTADLEEILNLVRNPSYSKIKEEAADKLFEKALLNIENKQYHEAISKLRKLINIGKKEAKYHRYLGFAALKKGWYTYAREEFLKAVEYDPDDEFSIKNLEELDSLKHNDINTNAIENPKSYFYKAKIFVRDLFEF